jgi:N-acylneuraminate cytidylyltransferase
MNSSFRHLALIPARGGSVGLKNKNLQKIGDTSLVRRAWENCVGAGFFSTLCLSTDSMVISKEVFPEFDLNLATDNSITFLSENSAIHKRSELDSGSFSSIYDLLLKISVNIELEFDFLWLIQPTTPFRNRNEFEKIRIVAEMNHHFTSIVSVKDVNGNHPDRMFKLEDKYLEQLYYDNLDSSTPRQLLPKVYIKDGGYYIFRRGLLNEKIFLGNRILPFIRSPINNINIDSIGDLNYARFIEASINGKIKFPVDE